MKPVSFAWGNLLLSDIIIKMASPPEDPPNQRLEDVKLSVETTYEAKMTIDIDSQTWKRAMRKKINEDPETITSEIVTLHYVEGNTYRVKFVVKLRPEVS